jgi:hypothetical protein
MLKKIDFSQIFKGKMPQRNVIWGGLIIGALFAFESFNFSTTDFALNDLLGNLRFAGMRWSTILAIAFCGIDFAGIARLLTPEENAQENKEAWFLFGAWLLAATMNAMLTWWGVSIAVVTHTALGSAVVPRETLLKVVPIFVAVMVWLIRILIIGAFSQAGDRMFGKVQSHAKINNSRPVTRASTPLSRPVVSSRRQVPSMSANARPKPTQRTYSPEPTYHSVSQPMQTKSSQNGNASYQ